MDKNLAKIFKLFKITKQAVLEKFNEVVVIKAFPVLEQNTQKIFLECHHHVYELSVLLKEEAKKYQELNHSSYQFQFYFTCNQIANKYELMRRVVIQTYRYIFKNELWPKATIIGCSDAKMVFNIQSKRNHQYENLVEIHKILTEVINKWYKFEYLIKIYSEHDSGFYLAGFIEDNELKHEPAVGQQQEIIRNIPERNQKEESSTKLQSTYVDRGREQQDNKKSITISTFDTTDISYHEVATINAQVVSVDEKNIQTRVTKKHLFILNLLVTDNYIQSLRCTLFATKSSVISAAQKVKKNDWVQLTGQKRFNKFYNQNILNLTDMVILKFQKDKIFHNLLQVNDNAKEKRIELHCHTKMSSFDGINQAKECLDYAIYGFDHKAIAITDINSCQGIIQAYDAAKEAEKIGNKFQLIYGVEFSLLPSQKLVVLKRVKDALFVNSICFDCETTGLFAQFHEVIEIGACQWSTLTSCVTTIFRKYIKISNKIPEFIQKLTRITDNILAEQGEREEDVVRSFAKLINGKTIVAHNANFDNSFLLKYFKKYDLNVSYSLIDSLNLARYLYPTMKSHRLARMAKAKNIEYDENFAHGAAYDAKVLCLLWEKMIKDLTERNPQLKTVVQLEQLIQTAVQNTHHNQNLLGFQPSENATCLARNQEGVFTLYRAITDSATKYYYRQERLPIATLVKNRTNVFLISPGVQSKLTTDILTCHSDKEIKEDLKQYDAVEINPPSCYSHLIADQKLNIDQVHDLIRLKIKYALQAQKIIYASGNVFYLHKNQKKARDVMINAKQIKGKRHYLYNYRNKNRVNPDHHFRNTQELKQEFSFLKDEKLITEIVVNNTLKVASQLDKNLYPITPGLHKPVRKESARELKVMTFKSAKQIFGENLPDVVQKRLETEMQIIIKSGYDIIYLTCQKLVEQAVRDHYFVGSRGSVGSSLVAFLNNITSVNPLFPYYLCLKCHSFCSGPSDFLDCGYDLPAKNCPKCKTRYFSDGFNIPFETFLGIQGEKIPDIDLNFDSEYQARAHLYLYHFFGSKNCFRAGTISTIQHNLAYGYVKNFEEETMQEMKYEEILLLCALCEGIKRTCGQHPGGIIVVPETMKIEQFTPVNRPANDQDSNFLTTHYPFSAIHHNLLKFDILGHDDPKVIKYLSRLTKKKLTDISFVDENIIAMFQKKNSFKTIIPSLFPQVRTIGIPEFGTQFVIKLLEEIKPQNFSDLVRVSGLSHGTNVWTNNFQVIMPQHNLEFKKIISCRDDIMNFLKRYNIAERDAFMIMEDVRKGKKITEHFLNMMGDHSVPDWFVEACLKISYIFPKAHASAYVISAWLIAWFKYYKPLFFYSAIFSIKCSMFDHDLMLRPATVIKKYINGLEKDGGKSISAKDKNLLVTLRLAVEFKERGFDFLPTNIHESDIRNFVVRHHEKKLILPFYARTGIGIEISEKIVAARKEKQFSDYNDLKLRTPINKNCRKYFEQDF